MKHIMMYVQVLPITKMLMAHLIIIVMEISFISITEIAKQFNLGKKQIN